MRHHFDPDKPWKLGSELSEDEQRYVLSAFVHHFTKDHKPNWAHAPRPDGQPYPVQFASDQDWLSHTKFQVNAKGTLDRVVPTCWSTPTWPDGDPR